MVILTILNYSVLFWYSYVLQTNYTDNPRLYHGLGPLRPAPPPPPPTPNPNKILAGGSLVTTVWNYKFGGERCCESKLFCPSTQYKESLNPRTQTCTVEPRFNEPLFTQSAQCNE